MYLEIINDAVVHYLDGNKSKEPIIIKLPSFLYKTVQLELNSICEFNTTVPIEGAGFMSITLQGRTITLERSDTLDPLVEIEIVKRLSLLPNGAWGTIKGGE